MVWTWGMREQMALKTFLVFLSTFILLLVFLTIDISVEFCESVVLSKSMSSIEFTVWEVETLSYQSGDLKLLRCSYP